MKTILRGNKKESGEQVPGISNRNIPQQLVYPEAEDIYNVYRKEDDYNPEDKLKNKVPNPLEKEGANTIADDDTYSAGLDVPGAERDNPLEKIVIK